MSIIGDHLRDNCMHDYYQEPESIKDYIDENRRLKERILYLEKRIRILGQNISDRSWSDHTQMGRY